ncbi:MAG: SH3 domain-containing protein [Anaerolineae bacterium]|nr:SH3 domain-containing protein [Anaerolineae bacterium]
MNSFHRQAVCATIVGVVVALALWSPRASGAQTINQCAKLITDVQKHLTDGCINLGKDQICYGNRSVKVDFQDTASRNVRFSDVGDTAPIQLIKSIRTSPLNLNQDEWGLVVLRMQATNLPNTTAGQAVTFIVYGDTTLTNQTEPTSDNATATPATASTGGTTCTATTTRATYLRGKPAFNANNEALLQSNTPITLTERTADGQWVFAQRDASTGWVSVSTLKSSCDVKGLPVTDPTVVAGLPGLNAFYFTTNISPTAVCSDIPSAGLLIQSPGGRKVSFQANGVDVTIGSTVVLTALPNGTMTLYVIQGQATLTFNGVTQIVNEGFQSTVQLGGANGLQAVQPPTFPRFITLLNVQQISMQTLCDAAKALGLTIPCSIPRPAPTFTPTATTNPAAAGQCGDRTFLSDGLVCIPNVGVVPCNRDGVCNNGEHSYICPEDCGSPPVSLPLDVPTKAPPLPTATETPFSESE